MSMLKKVITVLSLSILLFTAPFAGQAEAAGKSAGITKTAKSLTGVKYRAGGTTRAGFDCSGYVRYVYNQNGVRLAGSASTIYQKGKPVSKGSLRAGDLVFFNTRGKGVSHVSIYVGNGKVMHATTTGGVRTDSLNDPYYWGKRYVGAKRLAGI